MTVDIKHGWVFGCQNTDCGVAFERSRQIPKVAIDFGNKGFFSEAFRDRQCDI